jgi:hypothetical protein
MRKSIIIAVLLICASCKNEPDNSYLTADKAIEYFKKVEAVCNKDNGDLWGTNLYGPLMFVDRVSRKITANQPDNNGLLKLKDGVYTGFYPRESLISNTAVEFGGKLFALAPLPFEDEEFRIVTRAVHSLFHRFQETTGYTSSGFNTTSMDEKNARLWIKLEWKALIKAIRAEGVEKEVALRDALIFNGSNRELYHKSVTDRIKFENYEGVATFTYLILSTNSLDDFYIRLQEALERTYSMPSFARFYGGIHGALYATLMYQKGFDFKKIKTDTTDITYLVKKLYSIQLPDVCRDVAGSIALNYDVETIREEEAKRVADIRDRIRRQTATFVERPVLFLDLESPYFDFEPEDIHPMDTLGTLYSKMRVSDNWGKLTVDKGGCLVSNNFKFLRITSRGLKQEKNRITGDGWQILLNNNWQLVQIDQNYFVRRLAP